MKAKDLPFGHIGKSLSAGGQAIILIVENRKAVFLNHCNFGEIRDVWDFNDDYVDMGAFHISVEKEVITTTKYIPKITVTTD